MIELFEITGYRKFAVSEKHPGMCEYLICFTKEIDTFPDDDFLENLAKENNLDRITIKKVYDFQFK